MKSPFKHNHINNHSLIDLLYINKKIAKFYYYLKLNEHQYKIYNYPFNNYVALISKIYKLKMITIDM